MVTDGNRLALQLQDPGWLNRRTMLHAHEHIEREWASLTTGQVVDVRVILGETTEPAISDRLSTPESGRT